MLFAAVAFIAFIALVSSVAISLFVISVPCVVSILLLASWLMIFAYTFTGMALLTLPFAINIALSILLRIAFLITGSSCLIMLKLLPSIEFIVWMVIIDLLLLVAAAEVIILEAFDFTLGIGS